MQRRPQPVEAEPEHRHQEADGERRARLSVGTLETGERGRRRGDSLHGEQAEQAALARRPASPVR